MRAIGTLRRLVLPPGPFPSGTQWVVAAVASLASAAFWYGLTASRWVAGVTLFLCAYGVAGTRRDEERTGRRIATALNYGAMAAALWHYVLKH